MYIYIYVYTHARTHTHCKMITTVSLMNTFTTKLPLFGGGVVRTHSRFTLSKGKRTNSACTPEWAAGAWAAY